MSFTYGDITGCLAYSKAGHDKGSLYVVIGMSDDKVFLADGVLRKVSSPKKKNIKHIQPVKKEKINSEQLNDTDIKRAIKLFSKETVSVKTERRQTDVKN